LATHDDSHDDGRDNPRFGPPSWPPILQFIWGLLSDLRRLVTLVAVLLVLKVADAAAFYDLAQDVRHSLVYSVLAGSIATVIGGHSIARRYRTTRREKLAEKRATAKPVEGATAEPVRKPPGENGDDGLGKPGED
jgi:hypothetical protein